MLSRMMFGNFLSSEDRSQMTAWVSRRYLMTQGWMGRELVPWIHETFLVSMVFCYYSLWSVSLFSEWFLMQLYSWLFVFFVFFSKCKDTIFSKYRWKKCVKSVVSVCLALKKVDTIVNRNANWFQIIGASSPNDLRQTKALAPAQSKPKSVATAGGWQPKTVDSY